MQLTPGNLTALLLALNLTEGSYKPEPKPATLLAQGKSRFRAGTSNSLAPAFPDLDPISIPDFELPDSVELQYEEQPVLTSSEDTGSNFAQGCTVQPYNPPPVGDQTFPPFDLAKANVYRYRRQQSVNLGSWYVVAYAHG